MKYPDFFDKVPTITLQDPLANMLGAFEDGIITFSYTDIVKSAGHSCPTVAGAYLMSLVGLKALYEDKIPVRGEIKVAFGESIEQGVTGVIANVISNITGATAKSGFKGLGSKFARNNLMDFGQNLDASVRFLDIKSDKSIDIYYNPSVVPIDPNMQPLMQKVMQDRATKEEENEFKNLWQNRVKEILIHTDKYDGLVECRNV